MGLLIIFFNTETIFTTGEFNIHTTFTIISSLDGRYDMYMMEPPELRNQDRQAK